MKRCLLTDGVSKGVDKQHSDCPLGSCHTHMSFLLVLDEDAYVYVREHLHSNADKKRATASEDIDEEEGRDQTEPKLREAVHAAEEDASLRTSLFAQQLQDGDEVAGDRVRSRQLSQRVGNKDLLQTTQVGSRARTSAHLYVEVKNVLG